MSRLSIKAFSPYFVTAAKAGNRFLKWLVVISCVGFIVAKINSDPSELSAWVGFSASPLSLLILLCVLLLMPLNWTLEALKWQFLVRRHEELSLTSALKSVLSGVAAGIFTPNRVGEFAGKIFSLKRTDVSTSVALNFVAGLGQLLTTLLVGTIALIVMPDLPFNTIFLPGLSLLLLVGCFFLYANPKHLFHFLRKIPGLTPFAQKALSVPFSKGELACLFFLSFFRYAVFSSQFILLLYLNQVHVPLSELYLLISVTFLLSTIIPTFALTEVTVRGSMAVFIIGSVSANEAGILSSSLWLWVINLAVPALIGCAFMNRLTFFKTVSSNEPYH